MNQLKSLHLSLDKSHEYNVMFLNKTQNFGDTSSQNSDSPQENTKLCSKIATYELDQCQFAKENCMSPLGGMLNYIFIRYCTFQKLEPLFYVLAFLWMVFLFYMLSTTAEDYFCPSLAEISRILRLSPDIAGVTFLSFGNGAPDIFSTIAGIFSGSTGFGLGEPIGSGLFICSVLLACVTLVVKEAKVSAFPFLRDVITYLISVTFVFVIILVDGSINLWQSISFLAIYVAYVVFVIGSKLAMNRIQNRKQKIQEKRRCLINNEDPCVVCDSTDNEKQSLIQEQYYTKYDELLSEDSSFDEADSSSSGWKEGKQPTLRFSKVEDIPDKVIEILRKKQHHYGAQYNPKFGIFFYETPSLDNLSSQKLKSIDIGSVIIENHFDHKNTGEDVCDACHEAGGNRTWLEKVKCKACHVWAEFLDQCEWEENRGEKTDPNEWSKLFAVLNPIFMPPFVLFALGYLDLKVVNSEFPLWALLSLIGLVFSVFIFFTSKASRKPKYHIMIVGVSFIMSVIWIYTIANELVDVLNSFGIMWNISDSILSIALSAGNSLSDMAADVAVARQGFVEMAVAAAYSAPGLSLLFGLGISMTANYIMTSNPFPIEFSPTLMVTFVFLIAVLISSIIVVPVAKFHSPKIFAWFLIAMYLVYLCIAILVESKLLLA
ncbi:hypothetical protein FDP41_000743 [Naegleria fowleri]|uniref:Sodium/calcium exchanger membrane region domain-containing protein n=1 Tax=Naegleria fowleri TaxID=5763 RepID=A0A6A5CE29_NAEFO|nr:uncharacterized protein FDP41_000743 [Naegleria fowleri]KAF0984844.1 hypothetical protein FDP41_000743 [Naegleria fowleri]